MLVGDVEDPPAVVLVCKGSVRANQKPMLDVAHDPTGGFEQAIKQRSRNAKRPPQRLGTKLRIVEIGRDEPDCVKALDEMRSFSGGFEPARAHPDGERTKCFARGDLVGSIEAPSCFWNAFRWPPASSMATVGGFVPAFAALANASAIMLFAMSSVISDIAVSSRVGWMS